MTLSSLLFLTSACMQVAKRKAGEEVPAPKGASSSKEPHLFGWRDAMDIIVKWRQMAEPNDQVDPSRPTPKSMPHSSCLSHCSIRAKRVCLDCMLMVAAVP